MTYRAYFTRENTEYEVTADLYGHGEGHADVWGDTGRSFEITEEPKFYNFYAEDDNGYEIILTHCRANQSRVRPQHRLVQNLQQR